MLFFDQNFTNEDLGILMMGSMLLGRQGLAMMPLPLGWPKYLTDSASLKSVFFNMNPTNYLWQSVEKIKVTSDHCSVVALIYVIKIANLEE
jgi:hypothetical protein